MKNTLVSTINSKISPRLVIFAIVVASVLTILYIGILLATVSSRSTGASNGTNSDQSDRPALVVAKLKTESESYESVNRDNKNSIVYPGVQYSNNQIQNTPDSSRLNQSVQIKQNQPSIQQDIVELKAEQQKNISEESIIPSLAPQPEVSVLPQDNQNSVPEDSKLIDSSAVLPNIDGSVVKTNDSDIESALSDVKVEL